MMRASVTHNLRQAMPAESKRIGQAIRRAVARTAAQVQTALRAQARAGGFRDGGRAIANSWRLTVYPRDPASGSWKPAALVYSRMGTAVDAHDRGAVITARRRRVLAVPTPMNLVGGRFGPKRLRVTPQEMFRARGFVVKTRNPAVRLWVLPLQVETTKRGRVRLSAGRYARILTGNRKGAEGLRQQYARERTFVPMFFLMTRAVLRRRLNVQAVRRDAAGILARQLRAEFDRIGGA